MRLLRIAILPFLTSVLLAQGPPPAPAQAQPTISRDRIGLVLEGGGALGLAHIGVLQWFDEHHIPVDSIAGTSMGGLVAGLYASGMSAQGIEAFVNHIDWSGALSTDTPYRDLSFRRKEDKRYYPADLQFGLKDGISFPSGFTSGQEVAALLDRVGAPYYNLKSFDDLPTPFRCVAADLVSNEKRVFDGGPLSEALRATMSIPGVFSPLHLGNHVYIDGGLLENLPVDAARSMGAQKVIAVHLLTKPLDPKQALSAFDVLEAAVSLVISQNEEQSLKSADLVLSVATQDYTTLDYDMAKDIIERGYKAAAERAKDLLPLALGDADWRAYSEGRRSRTHAPPAPAFVEVTGTDPALAAGIEKRLAPLAGEPLNFERLDESMRQIVGLGRFSRADYRFTERGDQTGLAVHLQEKDYAPPIVDPLVFVDGSDYTNVHLDVGARITLLDLGGFGSEWRNDLVAGSDYGASSEYYHPLSFANPFFVAPRLFAFNSPEDVYRRDERIAAYRARTAGGGLDFGLAFNRFSQLRFGYQVEHLDLDLQLGPPEFRNLSGRQGFSRLRFSVDTTDDPTLPRQGVDLQSRAEFYDANPGAAEHFPMFETRLGLFHRVSEPASVFLFASGGTTAGYDHTGTPLFSLGGPTTLGAYGTNELLTNQYFLFQGGYFHRLTQLSPLLGDSVYLIGAYEIGKAYNPLISASRLPNDVNVGVLVQTIFGPIVVGGSVGDSGHRNFYVQVGRFFSLPSLKLFRSQ